MSRTPLLSSVSGFVFLGMACVGWPLAGSRPCLAAMPRQDAPAQDAANPAEAKAKPSASAKKKPARAKTTRKKGRAMEKSSNLEADTPAPKAAPAAGALKFSQDVAPILVANCVGCHSGTGVGVRRGKLDLSTFEKLQKGTTSHKIITPGKADESHLVLRVKGDETPRMPQTANSELSEEAVAIIARWVNEGALLDAGVDPKAMMESYASSPEQLRRRQLAKMSPKERDDKIEAAGRERWKQANPKLTPVIVPSDHFMVFSNLPDDRVKNLLKTVEAEYGQLRRILGPSVPEPVEKVSLYVFISKPDFVEFVRTVESRELDVEEGATSRLAIEHPYVAAYDPNGGRKEEPVAKKTRSRSKRGGEESGLSGVPERSLAGLVVESFGSGYVAAAGKTPRWLSKGLGAYLSSRVEPRSPYYRQIRQTALSNQEQGWPTRALAALGDTDQATVGDIQAVGFAIVEAMLSTAYYQRGFSRFVAGLLKGQDKLDDMLSSGYQVTRENFLDQTGNWVAAHYGGLR